MNAILSITLSPVLQSYVRQEFKTPSGAVKLSLSHPIGAQVYSLVRYCDFPQKRQKNTEKELIDFLLPSTNLSSFSNHFVTVTAEGERKIQLFIQSEFQLSVRYYFVTGYEKGFSQKNIINAFIERYELPDNAISYEAIKKADYRNRTRIIKDIMQEIESCIG